MVSRTTKHLFYALAGPLMKLNGAIYRSFRAKAEGRLKVQLGPGQQHYLDGWVNVDGNIFTKNCDIWADFRNKLPFRDNTVDAFYSHHVIEHLPEHLLSFHFREMHRCLKPGGVFRVGGPNGDAAVRKFQEGDSAWFSDFPDKRASLGGRLSNFIFCRGEHLTILTFSWLEELAASGGFEALHRCQPMTDTNFPNVFDSLVLGNESESTPDVPHTLIVEAQKTAN
jgi:predicted SAM-dependent methyltransferase